MSCWRKIKTPQLKLSLLIILVPIVWSCASPAPIVERPAITLNGLILSKGVEIQGDMAIPQDVSEIFDTTDNAVVALLSFNNLYGLIKLRWDWFGPDGGIFLSKEAKPVNSSEGMYFKNFSAWHVLTIAGDKVEKMPGQWIVKVYMNGELLVYKAFLIREKIF